MPKLPKSVVLEGRRYPTWALSSQAREQLVNLHQVDEHIAELRGRLAYYTAAREQFQKLLRQALPEQEQPVNAYRYYWHIAPLEWARKSFPTRASAISLRLLGAVSHYREGDRILLYVKGHGVVGWGVVSIDTYSTQRHLALCFEVAALDQALPAKALKEFALRHPNRGSQMLPESADVKRLLVALEARPGVVCNEA